MANTLQNRARQGFATAEIDWTSDDIRVVAVDNNYTYSAGHEDLADVPSARRVATADLEGRTASGGLLDGDDVVFPAVAAGRTIRGFWIYQDTGDAATSLLIYWIDTANGQSLSLPTSGQDITLAWSAQGIVRI